MAAGNPSILFARTKGIKTWTCPACGWPSTHLAGRRHTWRLQCRNCSRIWAFGEVIYDVSTGVKTPPPDMIYAYETWRYGRVNRIYCDGCSKLIIERGGNIAPDDSRMTLSKWRKLKAAQSSITDSPDPNEDRT